MISDILNDVSSWEYIKSSGKPVVIYGMGNGADKVIDELIRLDIKILGVTASDDFVRNQIFRGYTVKKLSDFSGDFILLICFGTCLNDVINHIFDLDEKFDLLVPVVPVYGDDIFNRSYFENNYKEIEKAFLFIEDESKIIYKNCIRFLFTGRLNYLKNATTEKQEAFRILNLNSDESYLDIGAYRGETIDEFLLNVNGKYRSVVAVEPDSKNFMKLFKNKGYLSNCTLMNSAVSSKIGTVYFTDDAGRQSHISDSGKSIKCDTVDRLNSEYKFSYIKIDAEGFEKDILKGSVNTLISKPKLNIAVYHRTEDIFSIPILLKQINNNYKIYLRKHPYIPLWDMNIYCV